MRQSYGHERRHRVLCQHFFELADPLGISAGRVVLAVTGLRVGAIVSQRSFAVGVITVETPIIPVAYSGQVLARWFVADDVRIVVGNDHIPLGVVYTGRQKETVIAVG